MKRYIIAIALILGAVVGSAEAKQKADSGAMQALDPVISSLISSYADWNSATFSGKLTMKELPVSPSVKIFMVRDSLLQMSVRVPVLGEIGRLRLSRDEFIVVNKIRKLYCQEKPEELYRVYPTVLADVQGLLLGRVVIFGSGELSEENGIIVTVEDSGDGGNLIIPQIEEGVVPFNYGYVTALNNRMRNVSLNIKGKGSLDLTYSYEGKGEKIKGVYQKKGKEKMFELNFNSVKWGGKEMAPTSLEGYTRVGIKEFIEKIK